MADLRSRERAQKDDAVHSSRFFQEQTPPVEKPNENARTSDRNFHVALASPVLMASKIMRSTTARATACVRMIVWDAL